MSTALSRESLPVTVFEGQGFSQMASIISKVAVERQQRKLVGLADDSKVDKRIVDSTPAALAGRMLLGEEEVFHGDAVEKLQEAAMHCGLTIGFAPEGSLERDTRVQKATAMTAAALAVGNRMGKMLEVYEAYQKGLDLGKRQKTVEEQFIFPHLVHFDAVNESIKAATTEKPIAGMAVRTIFQDQLFRGDEKNVSLMHLASRARRVYLNLSFQSDTKAAAAKVVSSLFQTKTGKDIPFDQQLRLGSAKSMMAQWDTEREAYIAEPIDGWLSRATLYEKTLRALQATGVYPKATLNDIRSGWAGRAVESSLRFLKRNDRKGETFHSPFRILNRLSEEALRRIETGSVSDLTLAQGLIGAIEKLYEPQELASYQQRFVKYDKESFQLSSLKARLSVRQLEARAARDQITGALHIKDSTVSLDTFRSDVMSYTIPQLDSARTWRTLQLIAKETEVPANTKALHEQLKMLEARRADLKRLQAKDLAQIAGSIQSRKAWMSKLGSSQADQLRRKAGEVEIQVLDEARQRRILYFEGKSPDALRGSIAGREKELKKVGLDTQSKERITAELDVLRKRQSDLHRLANKSSLSDVEGSMQNRKVQLSSLGAGDLDALRKTKIEVEITQLKKAKERLTVKK